MESIDRESRMRLMKFVCSFAWADLRVQPAERALIEGWIRRLELDEAETAQVQRWLEVPPTADQVDPLTIPDEHRQAFLQAVRGVAEADGRIVPAERDSLTLLGELLGE